MTKSNNIIMLKMLSIFLLTLVFLSGSVLALSSVTGNINVKPNTQEIYVINIDAPYRIDSDYTDGSFAYRYANWILIDKDNKIVIQGDTWDQVQNNYQKTVTISIPEASNKYAVVGVMTEINMTYSISEDKWIYSNENPIEKVSLQLSNDISHPINSPTPSTTPVCLSLTGCLSPTPTPGPSPSVNITSYWWIILPIIAILGIGLHFIR